MCKRHWGMVPRVLQKAVWLHYREGQCDDKRPSREWFDAADAAINAVADRELRAKTVVRYGIPASVPMISLWGDWADQVCNGWKTYETRAWEWTLGPGLVALHCTMRDDDIKTIPLEERATFGPVVWHATRGSLCALAWLGHCRPLQPADKVHALVYRAGLWAFDLEVLALLRGPKITGSRGKPIALEWGQVETALEVVL